MPSSRIDLSDRMLKCSRNDLYRPVDNGSSDASLYRLQSLRRLACMVFAGRHQNSGENSSKRGTHAGHAVLNSRYEGTLPSRLWRHVKWLSWSCKCFRRSCPQQTCVCNRRNSLERDTQYEYKKRLSKSRRQRISNNRRRDFSPSNHVGSGQCR